MAEKTEAALASTLAAATAKLESSAVPGKKRKMIDIACTACQRRKSKCDGGRPVCTMCVRKGSECKYSADLRRNSSLRDLNQRLLCEVSEFQTLTNSLCYGNELEVAEALRQLRILKSEIESGKQGRSGVRTGHHEVRRVTAAQAQPTSSKAEPCSKPSTDAWSSTDHSGGSKQPSVDGHALELEPSWQGSHLVSHDSTVQQQTGTTLMTSPTDSHTIAISGLFDEPSLSPRDEPLETMDGAMGGAASFNMLQDLTYVSSQPAAARGLVTFDPSALQDHFTPAAYLLPLSDGEEQLPVMGQEIQDQSYSRSQTTVLRSFQLSRRELLRQGYPRHHALGPSLVDATGLLSEERLHSIDPLSALMTRMANLFFTDDLTKLALMHLRHLLMQWLIYPCEETFTRVPAIMRPTPAQYMVPHPVWIDFIPLPTLRDLFVLHVEVRDVLWPQQCTSLRVAWEWPVPSAITFDQTSGALHPSSSFQEQADIFNVWSLSSTVIDKFPCLKGCIMGRAPDAAADIPRLMSACMPGPMTA